VSAMNLGESASLIRKVYWSVLAVEAMGIGKTV